MKKLGAILMCSLTLYSANADEAKGSVIRDLAINCQHKVDNDVKLTVNITVNGNLKRLRGNEYTTKLKTDLFTQLQLQSENGKKGTDNFFAPKGKSISLTPVSFDEENYSYDINLPRNAIFPTGENTTYPAELVRVHGNPRLTKKFALECTSKAKVENFNFPYLGQAEFASMPKEVQWRFIAEGIGSTTSDDFYNFSLENEAGEEIEITAQDEEKWGRWLSTVKSFTSDDAQGQSEEINVALEKAEKILDKELKAIDEQLLEDYNITQEELDEVGGGRGQVQIITNLQGKLLGVLVETASSNASEEGDDDSGTDYYYNAKMELISDQTWSN